MSHSDRDIPPFETFAEPAIFRNLSNINRFSLVVETPKVFQLSGKGVSDYVTSRMYDEITRALEAAEFYAFDRLSPGRREDSVGVVFDDDDFGFEVRFDNDGDIVLTRAGSSLARFHEWYVRLMPSIESLVNRVISIVADESLGSDLFRKQRDGATPDIPGRELSPVRVTYNFRFIAYDFRRPPSEVVDRNLAIMTRMLGVVPQEDGQLAEVRKGDSAALDEFGRIDIAMSRWSDNPGGRAREIYRVEAPGNRRHSSVWLSFSYVGETFQEPNGQRHVFDSSGFLKYFELPYVAFLRERALGAFLADLTDGFVFDTTAGWLP